MNEGEFWDYAEHTTEKEAIARGGKGVGVDMATKTVIISMDGKFYDFTIEEAQAMSVGLELAAEALIKLIAKTN
jgi:hypothetical protein